MLTLGLDFEYGHWVEPVQFAIYSDFGFTRSMTPGGEEARPGFAGSRRDGRGGAQPAAFGERFLLHDCGRGASPSPDLPHALKSNDWRSSLGPVRWSQLPAHPRTAEPGSIPGDPLKIARTTAAGLRTQHACRTWGHPVVVDEAHKMSAHYTGGGIRETKRVCQRPTSWRACGQTAP
jgi:hypothetical protein